MDFAMTNIDTEVDRLALWDFKVTNGILQTVDHNEATEQRAFIATYLQRGTIPQSPVSGNQWVELMTNQISPQALNAQIRQSIIDYTGGVSYLPRYKDVDGKVVVEVTKV
jgi:hypothetical protein